MKKGISKAQAQAAINAFFQRASWTPDELKKIKRRAMKYRLKLGAYRKRFCKKCFAPLRGNVRITKTHKTVACEKCGVRNKHALKNQGKITPS